MNLKELLKQVQLWWDKFDYAMTPGEIDIINSEINTLNMRIAEERKRMMPNVGSNQI